MHDKIRTSLGWLAVVLLLGANVAFASELKPTGADLSAAWTCGTILGPDGRPSPVCIDYLYTECSCSYCVVDCI